LSSFARPALCRAFPFQETIMIGPKPTASMLPFNWHDVTARSAIHDRLVAEARPINRTALLQGLADAGITHVVVYFDGYGDSGQIEDVAAKRGDTAAAFPAIEIDWLRADWEMDHHQHDRVSLRQAIETVVYDCLEETHQGWEINDGAYGEVTFDIAERTITLDYNERFTDSEYFQHVF